MFDGIEETIYQENKQGICPMELLIQRHHNESDHGASAGAGA